TLRPRRVSSRPQPRHLADRSSCLIRTWKLGTNGSTPTIWVPQKHSVHAASLRLRLRRTRDTLVDFGYALGPTVVCASLSGGSRWRRVRAAWLGALFAT